MAGAATALAVVPAPITTTLPGVERKQRYLRIVDAAERRIVTVVEILSPSNKTAHEKGEAYRFKREEYIATGVNLLEIDLLRSGVRPPLGDPAPPISDYYVLVSRAAEQPLLRIWPISVRDPLPPIPVPLDPGEPEPPLDLRAAMDRVYEEYRYGEQFDYSKPPAPPLREPDASWARDLLASRPEYTDRLKPAAVHIPVLRWEPNPTKAWRATRSSTSPPRQARWPRSAALASSSATCSTPSGRDVLREIPIADLMRMMKKAGELYSEAERLSATARRRRPVRARAVATTSLPDHMCRFNAEEESLRVESDGQNPRFLTRGLDLNITISAATAASRPAACPSATRPSRRCSAWCCPATRPASTRSQLPIIRTDRPCPQTRPAGTVDALPHGPGLHPGRRAETGHRRRLRPRRGRRRRCWPACRPHVFGSTAAVEQYKGNHVQAHGPGLLKILLGDDVVDDWRRVPRPDGGQRPG